MTKLEEAFENMTAEQQKEAREEIGEMMGMPPKRRTVDREMLIKSFKNTQRIIQENELLRSQTEKMQSETRLFLPGFQAVFPNWKVNEPALSLVEDTTFHCAQELVNNEDKVAVLNFANAYHPGGGVVNGAMAQEECLCRSSNLYSSLTLPYLIKNYYKWNSRNTGDLGSDSVIYSPGVTVFKTDDAIPKLMETAFWFRVDVITCAAPYYDKEKRKPFSVEKLRKVFHDRIENILAVAAANGVDILVLGAFGCGAFNNPPELVADVFYDLAIRGHYSSCFRKVVFAIKTDSEKGMKNYSVFDECFAKKKKEDDDEFYKAAQRFVDQPGQWINATPPDVKKRQASEWKKLEAIMMERSER